MHSHFKCTMKTKEKKNNITAPAKLHNIDGYVFLTKKYPQKKRVLLPICVIVTKLSHGSNATKVGRDRNSSSLFQTHSHCVTYQGVIFFFFSVTAICTQHGDEWIRMEQSTNTSV